MEERIEEKINLVIERIINKPTEEITLDDYQIMSSERSDIRFRRDQEESRKRLNELMASGLPFGCAGRVEE